MLIQMGLEEAATTLVLTVQQNYKKLTKKEVLQAKEARRAIGLIDNPSKRDFKGMVSNNKIKNCPITTTAGMTDNDYYSNNDQSDEFRDDDSCDNSYPDQDSDQEQLYHCKVKFTMGVKEDNSHLAPKCEKSGSWQSFDIFPDITTADERALLLCDRWMMICMRRVARDKGVIYI